MCLSAVCLLNRSKSGDEVWDQVQPELSVKFEKFENYDPGQTALLSEWNSVAEVLRSGELHDREYVLKRKALTEVRAVPATTSPVFCSLRTFVVAPL